RRLTDPPLSLLLSFFFSSRRRHTRFSRDWSSDVCSSDLDARNNGTLLVAQTPAFPAGEVDVRITNSDSQSTVLTNAFEFVAPPRSEERRVGKEGRSRRAAAH